MTPDPLDIRLGDICKVLQPVELLVGLRGCWDRASCWTGVVFGEVEHCFGSLVGWECVGICGGLWGRRGS